MDNLPLDDHCCVPPSRAKYKPVTHVIFDLDGTIVDTEVLYNEAISEVLAKYGKELTQDLKHKVEGTQASDRARIVLENVDLPVSADEFITAYRAICRPKFSSCKLMPGAETLIKHLHEGEVPIAIATSSTVESFELKSQNHKQVFEMFDHVVCGGSDPEVANGKPAPDIFLVCASRFSVRPRPRDCLVLEDAVNGVEGALAAGMQVVMIPRDDVPHEKWKNATLRLDSMEYMMPELFGLPRLPRADDDANLSLVFSNAPDVLSQITENP